ncbi:helicase/secretion neighborhood TadE-like protein [Saccharopolyspora kobensis]|uniref:Helicase/secretion neighborhood TadE-like protein n=2 Tax=Saccharopolyspora kobensis TaxID=146035 RepID=A0A1H6DBE6_9PSEU|nr:Rv3654c family TadE-like protein [Saccharopolyspora kobensis]SEG82600.1 helicase/secretion neighborhood TadE-like protein [Saccharopolyspora kobensis]SFE25153.1 helicase/secretion neighborhood TadE-like protein [Saccharopolyspora kobensis]
MNRDRGAATALSAILVLALLAVLVLVLQIGAATIARHRAEGAADLAALAAAAHAPSGAESACERAAQVAEGMRAAVVECLLEGWNARVTVEADLPAIVLLGGKARSRAHAGPIE